MDIKYPDVEVQLTGRDSNAFMVMGLVQRALRKAQVPKAEIEKYMGEAMSGDYDHLLQVTMQWVNVS